MADYIVCPNKRNAPRVNVLVCRERCSMNNECPAYAAHLSISLTEESPPLPSHLSPEKRASESAIQLSP